MRSSSLTESHLLRVRVGFHFIALQAKFSCELVLELRVQGSKVICETAGRPLKDGRCEVSQQLELQWLAAYDVGRSAYAQTIMEISVLAKSVHGSILAGIVTLDVTRRYEQTVLPLRKCSDKSSTLCLSAEHEFLQVVQDDRDDSKESRESPDVSHELKRMRSLSYIGKNEDSQLSISKIAVSNKRIENYLRGENEQLQRQIQINESKLKVAEKKEKEALFQLKESLIKCERLNNRTNELEKHQLTLQNALSESEKKFRAQESELKRESLKVKELQQNYGNLQKRTDSKQTVLNEQLRKMGQKLLALQLQLQQSTQAYSALLLKYEESETSNQVVLKEKEKVFAGERIRFSKEIYEKEAQLKDNQNHILKLREKVAELQLSKDAQNESSQLQDMMAKKNLQIDAFSVQNSSLKARVRDLEEELSQMRDTQEQKQPLRKRLNEVLVENNNLQLQIDKLSKNYSSIQSKNKELQLSVQSYSQQLKQQQAKLRQAISMNSLLAAKKSEFERDIAHYRDSYERLAELLKQEKEKNEYRQSSAERDLEDTLLKLEGLQTEKAGVEQQCSDMKWQIQKLQTTNRDLQNSHSLMKGQLFELKQQSMLQDERYEQLQQENRALQGLIAAKEDEIRVQQEKNKELFKGISDKLLLIAQLEKESNNHMSLIIQLKEQIQMYQARIEDCTLSEQKLRSNCLELKSQWQAEKSQLLGELSSKADQLNQLNQQLHKYSSNLKEVVQQNQFLSSENIQFTTQLSHKEIEIKSLKQINIHEDQQLSTLKGLLAARTKQLQALRVSISAYKTVNSDAVRWVLCLLGSSQLIVEQHTVFFPEQNLRELQLEAVKNRNLFLTKQRELLESIREEKQFITSELEKIGQEMLDCRAQFEEQLSRQRTDKDLEIREMVFEYSSIQNDLYQSNLLREQLKEQNDAYFKQNKLMEHQLEDLTAEKANILQEKMEYASKLKESSKEIEDLKSKLLELSHQNKKLQQRMAQVSQESKVEEINRLNDEIVGLEQRLRTSQMDLSQKHEKIRSLEQKTLILQSEKRKIEFTYTVSQDLYQQLQKQLQEVNKARNKASLENEQLLLEVQKKERIILHKEAEHSQILSQKTMMQEKINSIQATIVQLRSELIQKEQNLHCKHEQLKELKSKLKEGQDCHLKLKESLQLSLSDLNGQIAIYQLLAEQSASKLSCKELQVVGLRQELDHKKEVISKIEADQQMMQKEVFFEQSHKNTLSREFEELSQNYEHAKSEIYVLQQEKLRLEKKLEEVHQQLAKAQHSLEESLENSRARTAREVSDLKKRAEQQQARAQKQQAKCQQLKTRLKQLQSALQKKEFLILSGEQQRQRMRCDYEQEIQRIGLQLQRMQEGHEEHFSEYKQQRQHLLKQIEQLGQQCSQYNDVVRNLSEQLQNCHKDQEQALRKIALFENEMRSPQKERSGKQRQESKGSPTVHEFSYN